MTAPRPTVPLAAFEAAEQAATDCVGRQPDGTQRHNRDSLGDCCIRAAVNAAAPHHAAQARVRVARYIDRAVAQKRETAAQGFSADTIVADSWEEAAGWLRDATIWVDEPADLAEPRTVIRGRLTPDGPFHGSPVLEQLQVEPTRRLRECVDNWPDAETGAYDPRCCRFPKSCSATIYDPEHATDADLEPDPRSDTAASRLASLHAQPHTPTCKCPTNCHCQEQT